MGHSRLLLWMLLVVPLAHASAACNKTGSTGGDKDRAPRGRRISLTERCCGVLREYCDRGQRARAAERVPSRATISIPRRVRARRAVAMATMRFRRCVSCIAIQLRPSAIELPWRCARERLQRQDIEVRGGWMTTTRSRRAAYTRTGALRPVGDAPVVVMVGGKLGHALAPPTGDIGRDLRRVQQLDASRSARVGWLIVPSGLVVVMENRCRLEQLPW